MIGERGTLTDCCKVQVNQILVVEVQQFLIVKKKILLDLKKTLLMIEPFLFQNEVIVLHTVLRI